MDTLPAEIVDHIILFITDTRTLLDFAATCEYIYDCVGSRCETAYRGLGLTRLPGMIRDIHSQQLRVERVYFPRTGYEAVTRYKAWELLFDKLGASQPTCLHLVMARKIFLRNICAGSSTAYTLYGYSRKYLTLQGGFVHLYAAYGWDMALDADFITHPSHSAQNTVIDCLAVAIVRAAMLGQTCHKIIEYYRKFTRSTLYLDIAWDMLRGDLNARVQMLYKRITRPLVRMYSIEDAISGSHVVLTDLIRYERAKQQCTVDAYVVNDYLYSSSLSGREKMIIRNNISALYMLDGFVKKALSFEPSHNAVFLAIKYGYITSRGSGTPNYPDILHRYMTSYSISVKLVTKFLTDLTESGCDELVYSVVSALSGDQIAEISQKIPSIVAIKTLTNRTPDAIIQRLT